MGTWIEVAVRRVSSEGIMRRVSGWNLLCDPALLDSRIQGCLSDLKNYTGIVMGKGPLCRNRFGPNRAETRFLLTRSSDLILDRPDPAYCFRLGRDRITISLAASTCRGYSFPRPESFLSAL